MPPTTTNRTQRRILGGAVRRLREAYGIPQQQFALNCGISASYLANIEAGRKQPTPPVIKAISDKLGVDLDDITYVVPAACKTDVV